VRLAQQSFISVIPIPGPCALIAALSASGLPSDSFTFMGFLPPKSCARREKLQWARTLPHTVIFYESTHRIVECIKDILAIYGENYGLVLAKEISKTFETILHAPVFKIQQWLLSEPAHCKGEFVLILPVLPRDPEQEKTEQLLKTLLAELPLKQAVKLASALCSVPKNELYDLALTLKPQK
jgi:16S rRNA (cytidine1402-2'-O)-methyltransferase